MRVTYVVPAPGGSGGVNSIVQESLRLVRLGVDVKIAVDQTNAAAFRRTYSGLELIQPILLVYKHIEDLRNELSSSDVVVATICSTVAPLEAELQKLGGKNKAPKLAYYVQDYEPLFFQPNSPQHEMAVNSYNHGSIVNCFAKTDWLCEVVKRNHGAVVTKVSPSIDHEVYFAQAELADSPIMISAMVRPSTRRRAPERTVRILRKALGRGNSVKGVIFGATDAQLADAGLYTSGLQNQGKVSREQVAQVLRDSHLFLDLSDYQAFGRTGLEGMACGAVPVLPLFGGAHEYARHNDNAFLVDTRSDAAILNAIDFFAAMTARQRADMRQAALATAAEYSVQKAAVSILDFFRKIA